MILVAACPGGNVSNYISSLSNANIALSVSLTAIATLLSPIMTPLNFELWGSALPATREYLRAFEIGFPEMLRTVVLLLFLPLIMGIWFAKQYPVIVSKIQKPIGVLSFLILWGFIAMALARNFDVFKSQLSLVFLLVLAHNGIALLSGYFTAAAVKLPEGDRRTLAIETGIQNSGLGLIVIFTFFDGNGGMAIIAAWWGVWHIISGLGVAYIFRWQDARGQRFLKRNSA
jgi:BASS family bile acid:Na+ symporter